MIEEFCVRPGCGRKIEIIGRTRRKRFCTKQCKYGYYNNEGYYLRRYGTMKPPPVPCTLCGRKIPASKRGPKVVCSRICGIKLHRAEVQGYEIMSNCEICGKRLGDPLKRRCDITVCSRKCRDIRKAERHKLAERIAKERNSSRLGA